MALKKEIKEDWAELKRQAKNDELNRKFEEEMKIRRELDDMNMMDECESVIQDLLHKNF